MGKTFSIQDPHRQNASFYHPELEQQKVHKCLRSSSPLFPVPLRTHHLHHSHGRLLLLNSVIAQGLDACKIWSTLASGIQPALIVHLWRQSPQLGVVEEKRPEVPPGAPDLVLML